MWYVWFMFFFLMFFFLCVFYFVCLKVAHHSVRDQLLGYIYNGFLVPVMAPALHKVFTCLLALIYFPLWSIFYWSKIVLFCVLTVQLTLEEVMTTTAYLELFLRHISDPALLQTFLIFILKHRHDNVNILDTLVSRINTPFQVCSWFFAMCQY